MENKNPTFAVSITAKKDYFQEGSLVKNPGPNFPSVKWTELGNQEDSKITLMNGGHR